MSRQSCPVHDFGTMVLPLVSLDSFPSATTDFLNSKCDSWELGITLVFSMSLRKIRVLAISYRSRIEHTLRRWCWLFEGFPRHSVIFPGYRCRGWGYAPDSFLFSLSHQFNPQWVVMADFYLDKLESLRWFNRKIRQRSTVKTGRSKNWQDQLPVFSRCIVYAWQKLDHQNWFRIWYSAVFGSKIRTPRIPDRRPDMDSTWVWV